MRIKVLLNYRSKGLKKVIANLEEEGIYIPIKHAANSAAILDIPSSYFDLVRPGIMLYGLYPSTKVNHTINLKLLMDTPEPYPIKEKYLLKGKELL